MVGLQKKMLRLSELVTIVSKQQVIVPEQTLRAPLWHFLVWNRLRVWRTGRHTPTKNSQEYAPPDITLWSTGHQGGSILFHRSNFQEEDLIYSISTVHYNKEENTRLCE